MEYRGYNGAIVVDGAQLAITHTGMGATIGGLVRDQPRVIPLQALSGVILKQATRMANGYLTLGIGGGDAAALNVGNAAANADTVLFRHKDKDQFQALYDWLVTVVDRNRAEGIDPSAIPFDQADESLLERMQSKTDSRQQSKDDVPAVPARAAEPAPGGSMPRTPGDERPDQKPRNARKVIFAVVGGLVLLFVLVGIFGNDEDDDDRAAKDAETSAPKATNSPKEKTPASPDASKEPAGIDAEAMEKKFKEGVFPSNKIKSMCDPAFTHWACFYDGVEAGPAYLQVNLTTDGGRTDADEMAKKAGTHWFNFIACDFPELDIIVVNINGIDHNVYRKDTMADMLCD